MAQVTVSVNGRDYAIACGDGEEEHLADLAQYVDHHASALARQLGSMTEVRLLLMTALTIADELGEVSATLTELRAEHRRALESLGRLAGRLEEVAAGAERP
jgi:cell division protein ZapA